MSLEIGKNGSDIAESIRQHTLKYLPHYLTEFSDNVAARGGHVFFAADAKEANDYVKRIVLEKTRKRLSNKINGDHGSRH